MRIKRLVVFAVAICSIAGFTISAPPAFAEVANIDDPNQIVGSIAPELLGMSGAAAEISVSSPAQSRARGAIAEAPLVQAENPNVDENPVSFSIDYAGPALPDVGEFNVFETENDSVNAYVQASIGGVRVLTAIASKDAPTEYSYTFDVPDGTTATETPQGTWRLESPETGSLGILQQAWARDSAGKSIPTSYTWSNKTLTQSVDLSDSSIQFPVLADPNWNYTFEYSLGSVTRAQAWSKVHTCFNCFFPVYGAPANFPSNGSILPLRVGWGGVADLNFTCIMDSSWTYPNGDNGWKFRAHSTHIDGTGSWVAFSFYKNNLGKDTLEVSAYIVNDFLWGAGNGAYSLGAKDNWAKFAWNLQNVSIIT